MRLHNLFTSSSKSKPSSKHGLSKFIPESVQTGLWFVFFVVLFDVSVNLLFPFPANPRANSVDRLTRYFDYGRSIEAKIFRMLGKTDKTTSLLAFAGWVNEQQGEDKPTQPAEEKGLLLTSYGMSFSNRVSQEVRELDSNITLRLIAGPGIPVNHSFAAYTLDRDDHQADVVILAVLASSVKGLGAMSNMTWGFEIPAPVTYPHYFLEEGELRKIEPKIRSLSELRSAKNNPEEWKAFVSQLREYDNFFDPFVFEHNWLDYSALIRLLRRAYGQAQIAKVERQIYTPDGFDLESQEIQVLRAMVKDFAITAQEDGRLPIILILNDQGYSDHLFQALEPTLENNSIPYVSTHTIAPASDPRNFLGDGHFTKKVDQAIAKAVLNLINTHLDR